MNKEISDIFKDKLENFEGDVPEGLWSKFEQNTKWQSHLRRQKLRNITLYSVFVVVAVATAILLINNRIGNNVLSDGLVEDEAVMAQESVMEKAVAKTETIEAALPEETDEIAANPKPIISFSDDVPVVIPSSEEISGNAVSVEAKPAQILPSENAAKPDAKLAQTEISGKQNVTEKKSESHNLSSTSESAAQQAVSETEEFLSPFLIPNAFTPNGDGLNDIFIPVANGDVQSYQMDIYSRSGQKLFSTRSLSQGWNGEFQGANQTAGAYVFIIKYKDDKGKEHIEKGQLTLIR